MSSLQTSSLSDLADTLVHKLDRKRIFPPYLNDPEELVNQSKRNARPPRPPNGFLLCRKNVHHEAKRSGICNMRVISKVTGMLWRGATPNEKEEYEKLAMKVHNLHSQRYPGYKYRPSTKDKPSDFLPFDVFPSSSITDDSSLGEDPIFSYFSHNLFDVTKDQLKYMIDYLNTPENSNGANNANNSNNINDNNNNNNDNNDNDNDNDNPEYTLEDY